MKTIDKSDNLRYSNALPLWPVVFFLVIFIDKLYYYISIGLLDHLDQYIYGSIFNSLSIVIIEELSILFIIMSLWLLSFRWLRYLCIPALFLVCALYLIDSMSVQILQHRLTYPIVFRFRNDILSVFSLLRTREVIFLIVLAVVMWFFRKRKITVPVRKTYLVAALILLSSSPWILFSYRPVNEIADMGTQNIIRINLLVTMDREVKPALVERLKSRFPQVYQGERDLVSGRYSKFDRGDQKPSLIVLMSESLSTVDSLRSGGIFNRIPLIDEVQREGVTFTNVISNGYGSAEAAASLFLGVNPLPIMSYRNNMRKLYPVKCCRNRNFVSLAKERGYRTISITNARYSFLQTDRWLSDLGFDEIIGCESRIFRDSDRIHFQGCPSDELLYSKTLEWIDEQKDPFLMLVTTIGMHHPYVSPDPRDNVECDSPLTNILRFVDRTTHEFYQALEARKFFDNGILLIIGDHRRMDPLEPEEIEHRGELDAYGRVVCSMVGKGMEPGRVDDTLLNQSDLNILLTQIVSGQALNLDDLSRYNKYRFIGAEKPFATHLISNDLALTVIRVKDEEPKLIKLNGRFDPERYSDEALYQKIGASLIFGIVMDQESKQGL